MQEIIINKIVKAWVYKDGSKKKKVIPAFHPLHIYHPHQKDEPRRGR